MNEEAVHVLGGLAAIALFKNIGLSFLSKRNRKEYVGKVSRLLVYPVKSVRELPGTNEVQLTKHGVKFGDVADRHWMVSKNGDMFTMKQSARLTLITSCVQNTSLHLNGPEMPPLILPVDPEVNQDDIVTVTHWMLTRANGNPYTLMESGSMTKIQPCLSGDALVLRAEGHPSVSVSVKPVISEGDVKVIKCKNTPIQAIDCGDKAAAWVCKVLQQEGLRLNYAAPSLNKRPSSKVKKDWPTKIHPEDEVAFQDFVHCMIMCESSMEELNKRLENPVSVICFRPNLMIEGTKPFDEDNWEELFIGEEAHVRFVDKCTRCMITTIDPFTGVKDKGEQPLKELKTFRCMAPYGVKPCMGIHTCVQKEGVVKVGDPVYAIRKC